MPGGALTANTQMLRDNNLMDKYPEVIAAMGEAVKKGGFGTSVTPVSQFYFQQAFNNVMFGPWKQIAEGYGKMVLGYFGKTPVPPDARGRANRRSEQLKLPPTPNTSSAIEKDTKRGIGRATAILEKEDLPVTDENLFIVASCEEKGVRLPQGPGHVGVRKHQPDRMRPPDAIPLPAFSSAPSTCTVALNGSTYRVVLDGTNALVNGTRYDVEVSEPGVERPTRADGASRPAAGTRRCGAGRKTRGGRSASSLVPQPKPAPAAAKAADNRSSPSFPVSSCGSRNRSAGGENRRYGSSSWNP